MKQGILLLLFSAFAGTLGAQTRLSLYEEFTGEHCVPCATANPGLQSLIAGNPAKVILITYPTPVPAGGPIYNTYAAITNARAAYYGITTAPQGRLNGTGLGTGTSSSTAGNVTNLTQADINTAASVAAPFVITVSHAWSITGDSVTATINVTAPAAVTTSTANYKLRLALIENLHYGVAAGINGEQDFPNVVRDMFPSAAGTSIPATWTMGQNAQYVITNRVARYIDKNKANLIAWIQDDADMSIKQVALSTPVPIVNDAATYGVYPASRLQCVPSAASFAANATLRNAGTDTLRSARIYYHTDVNGSLQFTNWTGKLAPGGATLVALNPVSVPGGNHYIIDSTAFPNGVLDINAGNNSGSGSVSVYSTTLINPPVVTGFEAGGSIPSGWILYDADSNTRNFTVSRNIFGGNAGFGGSVWFLLHNNYYVPAGETNYAILPATKFPTGFSMMLNFAYAHAQYSTENDKLEVVYSTDCGANWTSVWSAAGSALSTAPATTDYFIPTASQWATQFVDLSSVPANAMLALRATSDYGNTLYLDNVRLEVNVSVPGISVIGDTKLYPNPAANMTTLDFSLKAAEVLNITLSDITGRQVAQVAAGNFDAGIHSIDIQTSGLANGLYMLRISGAQSQIVRQLSIVR